MDEARAADNDNRQFARMEGTEQRPEVSQCVSSFLQVEWRTSVIKAGPRDSFRRGIEVIERESSGSIEWFVSSGS